MDLALFLKKCMSVTKQGIGTTSNADFFEAGMANPKKKFPPASSTHWVIVTLLEGIGLRWLGISFEGK